MTRQMYFDFESILDFSTWLTTQLKKQKMSMAELSRKCGLSDTSIAYYAHGTHEPTLFAVCCVCKALGYTVGVVPDVNK